MTIPFVRLLGFPWLRVGCLMRQAGAFTTELGSAGRTRTAEHPGLSSPTGEPISEWATMHSEPEQAGPFFPVRYQDN